MALSFVDVPEAKCESETLMCKHFRTLKQSKTPQQELGCLGTHCLIMQNTDNSDKQSKHVHVHWQYDVVTTRTCHILRQKPECLGVSTFLLLHTSLCKTLENTNVFHTKTTGISTVSCRYYTKSEQRAFLKLCMGCYFNVDHETCKGNYDCICW